MDLKSVQVLVLVLVCWFLLLNCFFQFGCDAQPLPLPLPLPQQEVRALEAISEELKNLNWKVHQNSCINGDGFFNRIIDNSNIREVNCTCNSTICNILTIRLKGLNLVGTLPAAFANLTRLNYLDLSRNFINGSIPKEFGRIPLVTFNMVGNRLSGQIPQEIGDIASLEELSLEENELEGSLPERLGKLSHLRKLLLSSNNFTGSIPQSFGNLRNMTDFWIDGSDLSGKLPEFIGNWTKLYKLHIQGTSMENPIPRAISELENLTELMITDLKGPTTSFPNLTRLENLKILVLRNCLIEDSIPSYLGQINVRLRTLDLSFNRLSGPIPETLQNLLTFVKFFMFLNNNSLSGQVPSWIVDSQKYIDLSYNNFTGPPASSCPQSNNVNLVSSYSTVRNNTDAWCLKKDFPCPRKAQYDSLFINCGGERREVDGNEYESDETLGGKANFFAPSERWGYSSTGSFLINNVEGPPYKAISSNVNSSLYATARLAPVSLKYYGFCLHTGSYNVKLHFAEIMFTANQSYTSLGRRFFDVSIQGKLVRKNFNIMEEAGGVGKSFVLEETNIQVTSNTLEIHFYWAGKGTIAIPMRGVYGPLISAITVTPNFDMKTRKLSAGAIAGIVVGIFVLVVMVLLVVLLVVLRRKGYLGGKETEDSELRSLRLQTGYFSLRQIKAATNNFDSAHKIGEGGFGPVYKGVLSDGTSIAVKQLSSKSNQGNREFITEIGMISALQHPNLVKLYGCCVEGNQLLLIYEYLENNCLARALFGPEEHLLHLEWAVRMKICLGVARGLAYLHEESRLKIIHRDIKATNVLLDRNLNAKISDFGLAKLYEEENTHIITRIAGTIGYMAPEYATRGYLTDKADVYSFGIVALEIVSGKSNTNYKPEEKCVFFLDWARVLQKEGNLLELVDPNLGSNYSKEEVMKMLHIALLCTNQSPTLRPSMSSVVSMLEGNMDVQTPSITHNPIDEDSRINAFEILQHSITRSTTVSTSWMDSSSSTQHKDGTQYYSSAGSLLKHQ